MSDFIPPGFMSLAAAVKREGDALSLCQKLYSPVTEEQGLCTILSDDGQNIVIPFEVWGSDALRETALETGRMKFWPGNFGVPWSPTAAPLSGRVLVSEKLFAERQRQMEPVSNNTPDEPEAAEGANGATPPAPHVSNADLGQWFNDRVKNWPKTEPTPDRDEDIAAAKGYFKGKTLTARRCRDMRKKAIAAHPDCLPGWKRRRGQPRK